jgi:hypothetical protein
MLEQKVGTKASLSIINLFDRNYAVSTDVLVANTYNYCFTSTIDLSYASTIIPIGELGYIDNENSSHVHPTILLTNEKLFTIHF